MHIPYIIQFSSVYLNEGTEITLLNPGIPLFILLFSTFSMLNKIFTNNLRKKTHTQMDTTV